MNADRVISKINHDMNAFNESGGREDKACAEGLRRARTYVQQEVLKRKILTHDQQVVLEWLKKKSLLTDIEPIELIWRLRVNSTKEGYRDMPVYKSYRYMTKVGQFQVLAAFAEWGLSKEESAC